MDQELNSAISRRNMLKKTAAAGAVAFAAPVIMSSPAFAATGCNSGSKPCTTYYFAKISGSGVSGGTGDGTGTGCFNQTPASLCAGATGDINSGAVATGIVGNEGDSSGYIIYPLGAIPLVIQLKPGNDCYTFKYNGSTWVSVTGVNYQTPGCTFTFTTTVLGDGRIRVDFTNCQQQGLSHVNTYFCL